MRFPSLGLLTALALPAAVSAVGSTAPASRQALAHAATVSPADLARLAPAADPKVIELALAAVHCAQAEGVGEDAQRLAVIDYSRSSLAPRLWVFDLNADRLLYEEVVAHGQGSGGDVPTRFSNDDGSHASSLGLFVTRDTYIGRNGYSLRMDGLEHGINDAAMARAIVMHGAAYVNPDAGRHMGRLGRSWGCPALRAAVAKPIIDVLKDGQFVFSYYPDQDWLARSALLKCPAAHLARSDADAHDDSA
ncbi:MAG TPA: murein L,D-transpeptidase catalytic domain family protein [Rhodanobacteraceae bacterium]|nr:murein L,D-transpeptidase catalytic domain family protein [Rhodanobacteraceae bacterium]